MQARDSKSRAHSFYINKNKGLLACSKAPKPFYHLSDYVSYIDFAIAHVFF